MEKPPKRCRGNIVSNLFFRVDPVFKDSFWIVYNVYVSIELHHVKQYETRRAKVPCLCLKIV